MESQKGDTLLTTIIVIAVVIVVGGGLYFWQKQQPAMLQTTTSPSPIESVAVTPESTASVDISDWKVLADSKGVSFSFPTTWAEKPVESPQRDGNTRALYEGPEGFVQTEEGTGFGGACPTEAAPGETPNMRKIVEVFSVNGKTVTTCDIQNNDGTESFEQIYFDMPDGKTGSVRAQANSPKATNRSVILKILSTFKVS